MAEPQTLHAWFMGNRHELELIEDREGEYECHHEHADWSSSKCPRDEVGQQCLCKRQHNLLTLFFLESGVVNYVPLPFSVRHIVPLTTGLLLERDTTGESGSGNHLPTYFTLLLPTSELCPVSIRRPALGYITDPHLHLVTSCRGQRNLILLYNDLSGTHSIWEGKPATAVDIPAHVQHTPHGKRAANNSTITPRSASAPSQYDLHQTPRGEVETPVQMILTGNKKTRASNLQRGSPHLFSGGGEGRRGGFKHGSRRSPFVRRLQTPLCIASQKRSKSVSPLGRLSPFSQTIHSNTWSTVYSEESAMSLEPLLPQICMHLVFEMEERTSSVASTFFSCVSLAGFKFLYYITPSSAQLRILEWTSKSPPTDKQGPVVVVSVPATQAVPMPALNVVLVLSPRGELTVYSGTLKVCALNMEWMFQNGEADCGDSCAGGASGNVRGGGEWTGERVIGITAGNVETHFTAELSSGERLICSLPYCYSHTAVSLSVKALADILSIDTGHKMLADYYSTCIQLSPTPLSMQHFHTWLLSCLQLVSSESNAHLHNTAAFQHTLLALGLFESSLNERGNPTKYTSEVSSSSHLGAYSHQIFTTLHLVYQELKLYASEACSLPHLACLLHQLARSLGSFASYCDHYERDYPSLLPLTGMEVSHGSSRKEAEEKMECEDTTETPPDIMHHLHLMLRGKETVPFPLLSTCLRTAQIIKLYGLYTTPTGGRVPLSSLSTSGITDTGAVQWDQLLADTSSPYERVVLGMLAEGLTQEDLSTMPVSVALPLWDTLFRCCERAPPTWDLAAYDIIGRDDIVKTLEISQASTTSIESPDKDNGMQMDQEILKLRFPRDLRINEVKKMLNSSQPVKINLEQKPEVSDHEFIEQQEITLLAMCQRTMSLPIGRGMLTLATARPLPTSPLTISSLDLTGRATPRNTTVGLEHVDKPVNMSQWAEFHNGVATGLRIAPSAKLDSTWILSNRPMPTSSSSPAEDTPPRASAEHAGLLLALGLSGHLVELMDYELFDYLHGKHDLTTIAVLLGITASRVGSMQRSVASILSIFLPPLLPFGAADMEISQSVQTAALAGMGLLYMGSGNRHLAKVMLCEIGHTPGPELEFAEDRESYALGAGIALGMITLGRGGDLPGMGDLRLVERLSLLIAGGGKNELLTGATPQTPSHLVLETNAVNTHVTSPAATVALGLMYLKTNDSSIGCRLDAPNTLYELDYIRPDFFILRSVSQGLIMWDDVTPTQEWIDSHIPNIVQKHAFHGSHSSEEDKPADNIDYQTMSQALVCISAGCCMAIGLRYAGTSDQQAYTVLMKNIRFLLSKTSTAEETGKACLEMCLNVVVLSIAMVMSGSGDLDVLRVIRRLHARVTQPEVTYGSHMATHMALGLLFLGGCRYSLSRSNQAIATLYASLFPLFPSSSTDSRYHLQALRHLYVLAAEPRVLVTRDVETGRVRSVEVQVRGEQELSGRTPCIVPEWTFIKEIEICSPDVWPMTLNLNGEGNKMRKVLAKSGTVFVRQKSGGGFRGHLSQGFLPPSLSQHIYNTCNVIGKLQLTEDSPLLHCLYGPLLSPTHTKDSTWQRFLTALVLECVSEEKLPVFPSLLHLDELSRRVLSSTSLPLSTTELWQLKLGWALAARTQEDSLQLLHSELAKVQQLRVKQALYQYSSERGEERMEKVFQAYYLGGGEGREVAKSDAEWLAATAAMYDIPPRRALAMTSHTTLPQLMNKVQSLQAPLSAVVRLLPLIKSQLPPSLSLPFP